MSRNPLCNSGRGWKSGWFEISVEDMKKIGLLLELKNTPEALR